MAGMTVGRLPSPRSASAALPLPGRDAAATALLLAALAGVALAAAAAPLAAAGWPAAGVLKWLFHDVCHQLPERSFHWQGWPLAVCHRCMGLYLGFVLGIALWPALPRALRRLAARPLCLASCAALLAVDWALPNTAASRFGTGLVAAFPVALLALMALPSTRDRAWRRRRTRRQVRT